MFSKRNDAFSVTVECAQANVRSRDCWNGAREEEGIRRQIKGAVSRLYNVVFPESEGE